MTPDKLLELFNGYSVIIMFVLGVVVKYVPAFKKLANDTIPWLNALLYIVGKLAVGTASAAISPDVAHASVGVVDVMVGAFVNSVLARQLYEGFGRSMLEKLLGLKKPA